MASDTLDFEEPVSVLLKEIEALRLMPQTPERRGAIARLEARAKELRAEIYAHLRPVAVRAGGAPSRTAPACSTTSSGCSRNSPSPRRPAVRRRQGDRHGIRVLSRTSRSGRRTPERPRHEAEDLPELRLREARGLSEGAARHAAGREVQPAGHRSSSTRRRRIRASSPRSAAWPKRSR